MWWGETTAGNRRAPDPVMCPQARSLAGRTRQGGSEQLPDELPFSAAAELSFPSPSALLGCHPPFPGFLRSSSNRLRLIGDSSQRKRYMRCVPACGGEEEELGVVTTSPTQAGKGANKQAAPAPANGCCVGNTTQPGAESGS